MLCMDSFQMERFYPSIPNGVLTAHTYKVAVTLVRYSYSIQYFGTYYAELRPRKFQSVNRSVSMDIYAIYPPLYARVPVAQW